jgi:hypothetical protein
LFESGAQKSANPGAAPLLHLDFVDITPPPGFTGLDGTHDGVMRRVEMLCSVAIFRRIAAGHISAKKTHPQMDPSIAQLDAFFAALAIWFDVVNLIEMSALFSHAALLQFRHDFASERRLRQATTRILNRITRAALW